jgi:hypothetical protein
MKSKKIVEEEDFTKYMPHRYDKKVSFAKVNWGKENFVLAFGNSCDANACECNAYEFKSIKESEINQKDVPIWEFGARTAQQIELLSKMDISKKKCKK